MGDWWEYAEPDGAVALRVDVVEEAVVDAVWAQRVVQVWTDARVPGWSHTVEQWHAVEDHAVLRAAHTTKDDEGTKTKNETFSPPCADVSGLRLQPLTRGRTIPTQCGWYWEVLAAGNVSVAAGTFLAIPFEGVRNTQYRQVWVSDAACGPVRIEESWVLVELVSFECTPSLTTPGPSSVTVEPCPATEGYSREPSGAPAVLPEMVPAGSFLYVEDVGSREGWLFAEPMSTVWAAGYAMAMAVHAEGSHPFEVRGGFPNPPGCDHMDVGRMEVEEAMFSHIGDDTCYIASGAYDLDEVGFDAAGELSSLTMRFEQTCREPSGRTFRGTVHWEAEDLRQRNAVCGPYSACLAPAADDPACRVDSGRCQGPSGRTVACPRFPVKPTLGPSGLDTWYPDLLDRGSWTRIYVEHLRSTNEHSESVQQALFTRPCASWQTQIGAHGTMVEAQEREGDGRITWSMSHPDGLAPGSGGNATARLVWDGRTCEGSGEVRVDDVARDNEGHVTAFLARFYALCDDGTRALARIVWSPWA